MITTAVALPLIGIALLTSPTGSTRPPTAAEQRAITHAAATSSDTGYPADEYTISVRISRHSPNWAYGKFLLKPSYVHDGHNNIVVFHRGNRGWVLLEYGPPGRPRKFFCRSVGMPPAAVRDFGCS